MTQLQRFASGAIMAWAVALGAPVPAAAQTKPKAKCGLRFT